MSSAVSRFPYFSQQEPIPIHQIRKLLNEYNEYHIIWETHHPDESNHFPVLTNLMPSPLQSNLEEAVQITTCILENFNATKEFLPDALTRLVFQDIPERPLSTPLKIQAYQKLYQLSVNDDTILYKTICQKAVSKEMSQIELHGILTLYNLCYPK